MKSPQICSLNTRQHLKLRLHFKQGVNGRVSPGLLSNKDVKVKTKMSVVAISQTNFCHRINLVIPYALLNPPDLKHMLPW